MTRILYMSFYLNKLPPPNSTLLPYTTLFRTPASGEINRKLAPEKGGAKAVLAKAEATYKSQAKSVDYTDRQSTRLNSSHVEISYAVFCLKKKNYFILHHLPTCYGLKDALNDQ